ncbi:hypothetical protein JB92DRAFT_2982646 [Gautieria morchelliformis]|nr:hypothetical protein JB92DRAFT_2982646 [Gautieria morchelliformis]
MHMTTYIPFHSIHRPPSYRCLRTTVFPSPHTSVNPCVPPSTLRAAAHLIAS